MPASLRLNRTPLLSKTKSRKTRNLVPMLVDLPATGSRCVVDVWTFRVEGYVRECAFAEDQERSE